MQTTIQIKGIEEVKRALAAAPKQATRAVEITIDQTVKEIRDDMKSEIDRVFDKPVPWTRNSVKATPTKGHNMTGIVGLKQPDRMQQHYLVPQVIGGARHLKGFELAAGGKQYDLGAGAKRTAAGNITVGQAKEVVAAAGKKKPDYVTIKAGNKQGMMPGIYQRIKTTKGFGRAVNRAAIRTVQRGRSRGRFASAIQARGLKPILIEKQSQAEPVQPRLDFYGVAHDTYRREFARRFKENLARQMVVRKG